MEASFEGRFVELRGVRVLAAEDDATNQLVLQALLALVGIEPIVVRNGALAVEACRISDFDLILMDVQMPVMDGMAAAKAIRHEEAEMVRARTPIIALTANAMAEEIAEYLAIGMDAYVPKPIDVRVLFPTIERLLAGCNSPQAGAGQGRRQRVERFRRSIAARQYVSAWRMGRRHG